MSAILSQLLQFGQILGSASITVCSANKGVCTSLTGRFALCAVVQVQVWSEAVDIVDLDGVALDNFLSANDNLLNRNA